MDCHRARQMIADLEKQGASPDQIQNLTAAIEVSPELSKQVTGAAGQHIGSFGVLKDEHAAGEFDSESRTVNLPPADLSAAKPGTTNARELTFTVAHEVQHSYNQYDVAKADAKFADTARSIAQSPGPVHDYTAAIADVQAAHRNDEARAEIAGWNASVSAAQAEAKRTNGPAPTLESLYNQNPDTMGEFIQVDQGKMPNTYALRSNLTLNDDLTMPITAGNIEGMGKNYVDKPGAGLGPAGVSEYADFYGSTSVSTIAQMERTYGDGHATVAIDMNKLGLHQDVMEQNGIDLGSSHKPLSYVDTGTSPPTKHQFIQTASSKETGAKRSEPHLDDASHPDNGMYQQARDAVHRLDEQHGRSPDQQSDNLAASLTVAARGQGMEGIDHVVLSNDASRAYAVQGQMDSPLKQVAEVQTAQAANTSIAQSSDAWQQVSAQQAQQQAQQPQVSQDATVSQQQSGPVQAITMPPPGGGGGGGAPGGGGAGAGAGAPPGGQ